MGIAHSPFGGSVAGRILRCPASVGLVAKVPPELRRTSAYAERGTALHAAMVQLLDASALPGAEEISATELLAKLAGTTIGAYTITSDDVENALVPAYAYVNTLLDTPGAGAGFYLEHRVTFPGIDATTFGTCDLLDRIGNMVHVVDFKFGVGVKILVLTPDGDTDIINAQLLFYACAARHSLPEFFAGAEHIVLTIVQPQSADPDAEMVSSVEVTNTELDEFVRAYRRACEEALAPSPRLERGPWCRFCAARPICLAHTGPLLDLARFTVPKPWSVNGEFFGTVPKKEEYLRLLGAGLDLVHALENIAPALHDQAKAALDRGDVVPGYELSRGRAIRSWRDESKTVAALKSLGLTHDDIIEETMRSPCQVERKAKARGLKVPQELINSRRSGTSLMRSENVRVPALGRDALVRSFSEMFAAALKEVGKA
jgi:hypothetical protein